MKWKIFYLEGCVSEYDFCVADLPTQDVQIILIADKEVGRRMLFRYDYYIWRDGTWHGCDLFGLWEYLTSDGMKKVLFGRTVSHQQWVEVYQRAKDDTDMPRQTSTDERQQETERLLCQR